MFQGSERAAAYSRVLRQGALPRMAKGDTCVSQVDTSLRHVGQNVGHNKYMEETYARGGKVRYYQTPRQTKQQN